MRKRADRECEFVGSSRVSKQALDEIAGSDVVGQVQKELSAERIIAEILNGAAAVGRRMVRSSCSGVREGKPVARRGAMGGSRERSISCSWVRTE